MGCVQTMQKTLRQPNSRIKELVTRQSTVNSRAAMGTRKTFEVTDTARLLNNSFVRSVEKIHKGIPLTTFTPVKGVAKLDELMSEFEPKKADENSAVPDGFCWNWKCHKTGHDGCFGRGCSKYVGYRE
uniref:(northern house mosquito) hypothetical protein n=1 Tax=Culex pipiens TaxID=7175 RepID=A0A8D8DY25_CULPI